MIPVASLVNWLIALIVGAFGVIVYAGTEKPSTRMYALVSFFVQVWAISVGAYFYTETVYWLIFWNRLNHFVATLIAVFFYIFSIQYPFERKLPRHTALAIGILIPILWYLYFYTSIIIHDGSFFVRPSLDRYADLFWAVTFLFYGPFSVFFLFCFRNFVRSIREADPAVAREARTVLIGTVIGVIPPVMVDIILPKLGYYDAYWLAPPLALGWVAFMLYSIAKHRILNVRLVFAEVSVLVMSVILFANIFVSEQLVFGIAGRVFIFLAFAIVGGFFIRNIIQKEEQKEKLALLATELGKLNASLETQVEERTRELTAERSHTESIIEHLANGVVEYSKSLTVARLNGAAEKILGIPRNAVVGKPADSLRGDPRFASLVEITFPTGRSDSFGGGASVTEVSLAIPRAYDLQVATAPIVAPGSTSPRGYIKVIRDITREKAISREKSEFISIAAHQLRTPLSAINWTLEVILSGDKGAVPEKGKIPLARAHETNEKMIDLVNDLLNVARIEDGRFGFVFAPHNTEEIIQAAVADSISSPKEGLPSVTFERPTHPLPEIVCDPDKLTLALHNLLDNAIQYTPRNGSVIVRAEENAGTLVITIHDTGIGIPARDLPRLFTKFFRSENAKKIRTDGSGLGLYIVHNIVARHGGTIDVHSKEHGGTTFAIRLPLSHHETTAAEETTLY